MPLLSRILRRGALPLALLSPLVAGAQVAAEPAGAAPAAEALAPGEHHLVVDGVRFWYRVAGTAAATEVPVVFLHGGPGYNSHSFSVLAGPALEPSLRMVYYDQRGSGRSERPWTGAYSIGRMVEDLEGLRRALGAPRLALVGHSFGGTLALEYAAAYPERVARMVLVAPAADIPAACAARVAYLDRHYPADLRRARADTAGRGGRPRDTCDLAFNTLSGETHARANDEVMFPDLALDRLQDSVDAASGLRNTGELGNAIFATFLSYRFARPERVRMPVLVLAGSEDYAIGLPAQRALAAALPDAHLVEYAGAGHFLYLDQPARFTREVVAFLRGDAVVPRSAKD